MSLIERRNKAAERNFFTLTEKLKKSTQAWTAKLTGVQHWKPETGYDVFVFDPNHLGETYVLFRRWNEEKRTFDETIKKHQTGHTDPAGAVQQTKDWVSNNWASLKSFDSDDKVPEEKSPTEVTSTPVAPSVLQAEIKTAYEDVTEEELCRFENFLDDGLQTDEEKEEAWRHPWLRRLNNQLNEMSKDRSQYERAMQQRRDDALEKSLPNLLAKIDSIAKKGIKK